MKNIYTDQSYLNQNPSWHDEDSPWKADQVLRLLRQHPLQFKTVAEVGCGAGGILAGLHEALPDCTFDGFDIAPEAIAMARQRASSRLRFHDADFFATDARYDVLLIMDVIEHVPDYLGFMERCRTKARYKIYHIPLDIHVSSVTRASLLKARESVGHIHYFTAESALATLADTGHKILQTAYTNGGVALASLHPSVKRTLANFPRQAISTFSTAWAARLLGGYSLLVLAE